MPVSFRSELFTSYILIIFKQWNHTPVNMRNCQIELFMHVKILQKKMNLLKMCGPQIRLCLFTFRPIASKQLNSLTTLDTFSWLGGAVVTHSLWMQEVSGSISGSGKGFYVWLFCFVVVVLLLFVPKLIICHNILLLLLQC